MFVKWVFSLSECRVVLPRKASRYLAGFSGFFTYIPGGFGCSGYSLADVVRCSSGRSMFYSIDRQFVCPSLKKSEESEVRFSGTLIKHTKLNTV